LIELSTDFHSRDVGRYNLKIANSKRNESEYHKVSIVPINSRVSILPCMYEFVTDVVGLFLLPAETKIIGTDTDGSGYIYSNHGPILCRYQDIARYWPKIANFSEPTFI